MNSVKAATARRLRMGACLSLSGRYARFGRQAAQALTVWRSFDDADVIVEDDQSEPSALEAAMARLSGRCDVFLGPYSTQLMRTAGRVAAENGWLLWNHGGSGDDVEGSHPGHVVSVLTPTRRYGEPFLQWLAKNREPAKVWIVQGRGSFARQVATGAVAEARRLGIDATQVGSSEVALPNSAEPWDLFSVGTFEADVEFVDRAQKLLHPPRTICAVAAGVQEFADEVEHAEGIFGVGQWVPGSMPRPQLGPSEAEFLEAYTARFGSTPDYPAVQAVAAAILSAHCVRQAGGASRRSLWVAASRLDTSTLFGSFKIDPATGAQVKHDPVLVRWSAEGLELTPAT